MVVWRREYQKALRLIQSTSELSLDEFTNLFSIWASASASHRSNLALGRISKEMLSQVSLFLSNQHIVYDGPTHQQLYRWAMCILELTRRISCSMDQTLVTFLFGVALKTQAICPLQSTMLRRRVTNSFARELVSQPFSAAARQLSVAQMASLDDTMRVSLEFFDRSLAVVSRPAPPNHKSTGFCFADSISAPAVAYLARVVYVALLKFRQQFAANMILSPALLVVSVFEFLCCCAGDDGLDQGVLVNLSELLYLRVMDELATIIQGNITAEEFLSQLWEPLCCLLNPSAALSTFPNRMQLVQPFLRDALVMYVKHQKHQLRDLTFMAVGEQLPFLHQYVLRCNLLESRIVSDVRLSHDVQRSLLVELAHIR